jgi:hypothetical protein
MVDAKCFDLDDDITGLGLRIGNLLVNKAVESPNFSKTTARISVLQVIGTDFKVRGSRGSSPAVAIVQRFEVFI